MYVNEFNEKFKIDFSDYNIRSADNKHYDRYINPFDLNILFNYPYENVDKNKSCFLEIKTDNEKILLIFKTDTVPSLDELFEPYYNYDTDEYDVSYNFSLMNKDNQLVVMFGNSIMILDCNNFNVLKHVFSDRITNYGINLIYRKDYYIVEDFSHNFVFFDENLNVLEKETNDIEKIKMELISDSKKKYYW